MLVKRRLFQLRRIFKRINFHRLLGPWGVFRGRYTPEENHNVVLYNSSPNTYSSYHQQINPSKRKPQIKVKVSLVATGRDERQNAAQWVENILAGSRRPEEIVVVDGGSQDGTYELLNRLASQSPVPFRVIPQSGANIAQGRNLAISQAQFDTIAVTDFGCRPQTDWLKNLIAPFEIEPETQVAAGVYQAVDHEGHPLHRRRWQKIEQIQPQNYLPSSRSIAFTKAAWQAVGGYPEWLTVTGEDTYFAMELKRIASRWAFVPEAIVDWHAPKGMIAYWRKQHYWSIGDGEAGMNARYYWRLAQRYGFALLGSLAGGMLLISSAIFSSWIPFSMTMIGLALLSVWVMANLRTSSVQLGELVLEVGGQLAQLAGYLQGTRNRPQADRRRQASLEGVFFILAVVPIDDTGGGARSAQIARELILRRYLVIYLNKYPSYESIDLKLEFCHPNLIAQRFSRFSLEQFKDRISQDLRSQKIGALVELPDPDFLPLINTLKKWGGTIIYDLLDDWDSTLGGSWYSLNAEKNMIQQADVLVATTPPLLKHLEAISNKPAYLLPNAVNHRLFNPDRYYARPQDLPDKSSPTIMYIGALWGDWFDWGLLIEIAKECSKMNFVLIGDYHNQCPEHLPNLYFLGLKPQAILPAYLAYSNVTFIPWKTNAITLATSPLKLYEYLAMRKPVVAPDFPHLHDIPYVFLSKNLVEYVSNIQHALQIEVDASKVDEYIKKNSWQVRVDQITGFLDDVTSPNA